MCPVAVDSGGGDDHHSLSRPVPEECFGTSAPANLPQLHSAPSPRQCPYLGHPGQPHQRAFPSRSRTQWTLLSLSFSAFAPSTSNTQVTAHSEFHFLYPLAVGLTAPTVLNDRQNFKIHFMYQLVLWDKARASGPPGINVRIKRAEAASALRLCN